VRRSGQRVREGGRSYEGSGCGLGYAVDDENCE
jgi:hypothetical protein